MPNTFGVLTPPHSANESPNLSPSNASPEALPGIPMDLDTDCDQTAIGERETTIIPLGDPHFRPFGRDPTPLQFVPNLVSSSQSTDTQRTSNRPLWLQCPIRPPESISVGSRPVVGERRQQGAGDDSHDDAPIEERHEEDGEREDDDGDQEDAGRSRDFSRNFQKTTKRVHCDGFMFQCCRWYSTDTGSSVVHGSRAAYRLNRTKRLMGGDPVPNAIGQAMDGQFVDNTLSEYIIN
ncbi:hypothetical protein LQV05_002757 [Cryptococcus neoformans]|nr:hypothetical protein LQV05_002757 [Cryptococcus neoformans]